MIYTHMARLETQINQIYLTLPENKNSSLILYEEVLYNTSHLFVLSELKNLKRKSEAQDLKKISEIILGSFRANKKLPAEALFESALSQINQNLADLAHAGHKSWVGKFSCLITLRAGDNIYLANNGQTCAWLARQSELLEILSPEKLGSHPIKTFVNFSQGKIQNGDSLIATTSNIFNFISLQVFTKIIAGSSLQNATSELSKILKGSLSSEEGFAAFLIGFDKNPEASEMKIETTQTIYAPLPEEVTSLPARLPKLKWRVPKLPTKITLPKFRLGQWQFFKNLSRAGKFFFISFSIFLLLFLGNLGVYAINHYGQKTQDKINQLADAITKDISDSQSALIYKNNSEALRLLSQANDNYANLQKLSKEKAAEFATPLQALKNQINKVSTIFEPKIFLELKHRPTYLNRASIGLLFANQDSNSLSLFDTTLKDYFLLNSLKNAITGINYYSPAGVVVSSGDTIFHINQTLKQFEGIMTIGNGQLIQVKPYANNLYTLNLTSNQVVKIGFAKSASGGKYTSTLINAGDLKDVRDFALDKDIYLLCPEKLIKITGGQPQAFTYPVLSDPITNANKIIVGTNLYILEANKKRVVILNKNGQLQNQFYFPNSQNLFDFAVDEAGRNIYLLDENKVYKITF